eukprot:3751891-Amphidinium_carterae.1
MERSWDFARGHDAWQEKMLHEWKASIKEAETALDAVPDSVEEMLCATTIHGSAIDWLGYFSVSMLLGGARLPITRRQTRYKVCATANS